MDRRDLLKKGGVEWWSPACCGPTSVGQIFVGPGAVYYIATNTDDPHGYVTRVTATRK